MTHILLIEDDAWLAELEAGILERAGYEVTIAPHAPVAMQLVDQRKPDGIVADVLLAGSTVFALLHELQSYSDTGVIPVVLCTNLAEQFSVDDMSGYGIRRIVDKATMDPAELVAAVKAVIG